MSAADENCQAWLQLADGRRFPIAAGCNIGRLGSNQIVLADDKVSRRHAIVHAQGENEYWLIDLGSSNGTLLNGRRVSRPVRLKDRDQIQVGDCTLRFDCVSHPSLTATRADATTLFESRTAECWLLVTDIIGSTRLGRELGATELSRMFGRWFDACQQIIELSHGNIDKYLGDGFFAFWPAAGESASGIANVLTEFKAMQRRASPGFRLVAHLGAVFSGELATMGEARLFGQEVNFAFRMERLAASLGQDNLISSAAAGKVRDQLSLKTLGRHRLTGFEGSFAFYGF